MSHVSCRDMWHVSNSIPWKEKLWRREDFYLFAQLWCKVTKFVMYKSASKLVSFVLLYYCPNHIDENEFPSCKNKIATQRKSLFIF